MVCWSLERITMGTFRACRGLGTVDFGNGLREMHHIGGGAFSGCWELTKMPFPKLHEGLGGTFAYSGVRLIRIPASWAGTPMLASADLPKSCRVLYYGPASAE